ncbi:MAG: hypothetical protein ABW047_06965 [Nitrospiraceae bacterium]|jgi:hypothetical protein
MFKPLLPWTVCMLFLFGVVAPLALTDPVSASTTFTRVTVKAIDTAAPSLTFRTTDGQEWTLPASSAELLNGLRKGDTCNLEIDLQDRVVKIVKAASELP